MTVLPEIIHDAPPPPPVEEQPEQLPPDGPVEGPLPRYGILDPLAVAPAEKQIGIQEGYGAGIYVLTEEVRAGYQPHPALDAAKYELRFLQNADLDEPQVGKQFLGEDGTMLTYDVGRDTMITESDARTRELLLGRMILDTKGRALRLKDAVYVGVDFKLPEVPADAVTQSLDSMTEGFTGYYGRRGSELLIGTHDYVLQRAAIIAGIENRTLQERERAARAIAPQNPPNVYAKAVSVDEAAIIACLADPILVQPDRQTETNAPIRIIGPRIARDHHDWLTTEILYEAQTGNYRIMVDSSGKVSFEQFVGYAQPSENRVREVWAVHDDPLLLINALSCIPGKKYDYGRTRMIVAIKTENGGVAGGFNIHAGAETLFPETPLTAQTVVCKNGQTEIYADGGRVESRPIRPLETEFMGTITKAEMDQAAISKRYRDLRLAYEKKAVEEGYTALAAGIAAQTVTEIPITDTEQKTLVARWTTWNRENHGVLPVAGNIHVIDVRATRSLDEYAQPKNNLRLVVRINPDQSSWFAGQTEYHVGANTITAFSQRVLPANPNVPGSQPRTELIETPMDPEFQPMIRYNLARALRAPGGNVTDIAVAFNFPPGAGTERSFVPVLGTTGTLTAYEVIRDTAAKTFTIRKDAETRMAADTVADRTLTALYQFLHGELVYDPQTKRLLVPPTAGTTPNPAFVRVHPDGFISTAQLEEIQDAARRLWYREKMTPQVMAIMSVPEKTLGKRPPQSFIDAIARQCPQLAVEYANSPAVAQTGIGWVFESEIDEKTGQLKVWMVWNDVLAKEARVSVPKFWKGGGKEHLTMGTKGREVTLAVTTKPDAAGTGFEPVMMLQVPLPSVPRYPRVRMDVVTADSHDGIIAAQVLLGGDGLTISQENYLSAHDAWVAKMVKAKTPGFYLRKIQIHRRMVATEAILVTDKKSVEFVRVMPAAGAPDMTPGAWRQKKDKDTITPGVVYRHWLEKGLWSQHYAVAGGSVLAAIENDVSTETKMSAELKKRRGAQQFYTLVDYRGGLSALIAGLSIDEHPDAYKSMRVGEVEKRLKDIMDDGDYLFQSNYAGDFTNYSGENQWVVHIQEDGDETFIAMGIHDDNDVTIVSKLVPKSTAFIHLLRESRDAAGKLRVEYIGRMKRTTNNRYVTDNTDGAFNIYCPPSYAKREEAGYARYHRHAQPAYLDYALDLVEAKLDVLSDELLDARYKDLTFTTVDNQEARVLILADIMKLNLNMPNRQSLKAAIRRDLLDTYWSVCEHPEPHPLAGGFTWHD